jgi:hypothetical protein
MLSGGLGPHSFFAFLHYVGYILISWAPSQSRNKAPNHLGPHLVFGLGPPLLPYALRLGRQQFASTVLQIKHWPFGLDHRAGTGG